MKKESLRPVVTKRFLIRDVLTRKCLAEMIGTFMLVLAGCGSAVLAGHHVGLVGVSMAFGLALTIMMYVMGPISGAHLNPAVTLGMLLGGKMKGREAGAYAASQIVGAVFAAGLLWLIVQGSAAGYDMSRGLGSNGFGDHSPERYSLWAGGILEVVLTGLLVYTILATSGARTPPGFAPIVAGTMLTLVHLIALPVTNGSFNPARSIGPAVFAGGWALQQLWLFLLAPIMGAALAVGFHMLTHRAVADADKSSD